VIFYADATEMSRDVQDLLIDVSIAKLGNSLYREGTQNWYQDVRLDKFGCLVSGIFEKRS
jgi:hypothetical protein